MAAAAIVGCGSENPHIDALRPQRTIDCQLVSGSFYPVRGHRMEDNVVGTNVFRGRGSPILILVSYFVVNGEVLRLDSLRFTAVSPSGATIAEAKSALLLNHPLAGDEELQLGDLPIEFKGDGSVRGRDPYSTDNRTLYNVVLTFDGVLPEQFDLHLPDVWLEDKKYPSRIFGFKQFQGIGLGLCRT